MRCWLLLLFAFLLNAEVHAWGFWGHRRINRFAVYLLPEEMHPLFRTHIDFLENHAADPDKRRYLNTEEAPRHYIDLDRYGHYPFDSLPRSWWKACSKYGEDSIKAHGMVPWQISFSCLRLVKAFESKDALSILKASADLGHYAADACVPLHTTSNYNGQFTGQQGIHAFWESRLPELFGEDFNYLNREAVYFENPLEEAWKVVLESHLSLDTVFREEAEIRKVLPEELQYSIESRGSSQMKVISEDWAKEYARRLDGMVERRMLRAIQFTASLWYTCWRDAGSPKFDPANASLPAAVVDAELELAERLKNAGQKPHGHGHAE